MLRIFEQEYYDADVEYEVWVCDDNGMPNTLVDTFASRMDAEHELVVLNCGKMLGDPAGDYTL